MPNFTFDCARCGHSLEEFLFLNDPRPESCPECGAAKPDFGQRFHGQAPMGWVKGDPKTFGQQAELNAQRMGKEQMQRMREEALKKKPFTGKLPEGASINREYENVKELPWYRDGSVPGLPKREKPLNLDKVKDVTKYVMTGEGAGQ